MVLEVEQPDIERGQGATETLEAPGDAGAGLGAEWFLDVLGVVQEGLALIGPVDDLSCSPPG